RASHHGHPAVGDEGSHVAALLTSGARGEGFRSGNGIKHHGIDGIVAVKNLSVREQGAGARAREELGLRISNDRPTSLLRFSPEREGPGGICPRNRDGGFLVVISARGHAELIAAVRNAGELVVAGAVAARLRE